MQITNKIKEVLTEYNINLDLGLQYLLCLHFELDTSNLSDEIKKKINIAKILDKNYDTGEITWNYDLFENNKSKSLDTKWEWLNTIRDKFKAINPERNGSKSSIKLKLQKFMLQNPDVTKIEIIGAFELYLNEFKLGNISPDYLMSVDYFIYKQDSMKVTVSKLEQYIEKFNEKRIKEANSLVTPSAAMLKLRK